MNLTKAEVVQTRQEANSEQNYDFLQTFKNAVGCSQIVNLFFRTDTQCDGSRCAPLCVVNGASSMWLFFFSFPPKLFFVLFH